MLYGNEITQLPIHLCKLTALETLNVEDQHVDFQLTISITFLATMPRLSFLFMKHDFFEHHWDLNSLFALAEVQPTLKELQDNGLDGSHFVQWDSHPGHSDSDGE